MSELLDTVHPLFLYSFIFFGKILEVSISTVRIVLITKGEKLIGSFIAFFEVLLWVILAVTILTDIMSDPFKVVVYALAFALGNFFGTMIEDKIAVGTIRVEAIVRKDLGKKISLELRERGFGVTATDAYGKEDRKEILIVHIPRKEMRPTLDLLKSYDEQMMITINDIRPVYGGYGILRK